MGQRVEFPSNGHTCRGTSRRARGRKKAAGRRHSGVVGAGPPTLKTWSNGSLRRVSWRLRLTSTTARPRFADEAGRC